MVQPQLELLTYQFFSYKWSLHNNQSSVVDQSYNHKVSMCDSLPSKLPTMTFNNIEIRRENSIKFLGVIIDENLIWKNHIEVVENKIFKNIGVPLKIYFSFIHIYISYANIVWASTFKTKLQGILKKQKHAARITFHANRLDHARPLLK